MKRLLSILYIISVLGLFSCDNSSDISPTPTPENLKEQYKPILLGSWVKHGNGSYTNMTFREDDTATFITNDGQQLDGVYSFTKCDACHPTVELRNEDGLGLGGIQIASISEDDGSTIIYSNNNKTMSYRKTE